jgi:hypothetical protein
MTGIWRQRFDASRRNVGIRQQVTGERGKTAPITALDLAPAELSEATKACSAKCEDKLGLVPNVLLACAFNESLTVRDNNILAVSHSCCLFSGLVR